MKSKLIVRRTDNHCKREIGRTGNLLVSLALGTRMHLIYSKTGLMSLDYGVDCLKLTQKIAFQWLSLGKTAAILENFNKQANVIIFLKVVRINSGVFNRISRFDVLSGNVKYACFIDIEENVIYGSQ